MKAKVRECKECGNADRRSKPGRHGCFVCLMVRQRNAFGKTKTEFGKLLTKAAERIRELERALAEK